MSDDGPDWEKAWATGVHMPAIMSDSKRGYERASGCVPSPMIPLCVAGPKQIQQYFTVSPSDLQFIAQGPGQIIAL